MEADWLGRYWVCGWVGSRSSSAARAIAIEGTPVSETAHHTLDRLFDGVDFV